MLNDPDLSLGACEARDAQDPLRELRGQFTLPEGVIYLDGNSLGALPAATAATLAHTVADEWGRGLIGSWNHAGWFALPQRLGDRLAPWIGAAPGEAVENADEQWPGRQRPPLDVQVVHRRRVGVLEPAVGVSGVGAGRALEERAPQRPRAPLNSYPISTSHAPAAKACPRAFLE